MTSQTAMDPMVTEQDGLLELALGIQTKVQKIIAALQDRGLPSPSLAENAPTPDFLPPGDTELQELRRQVVGDARTLADIFTGPRKYLNEYCLTGVSIQLSLSSDADNEANEDVQNHQAMTLQVLYRFRLPELVPLGGTISYADLSKACGLDEARLTRIVRYLIISHIFTEPVPGEVGHSAISRLLATETQSMDFLGHTVEDMFPAAAHQTEALQRSPHGTSPLDAGAALAFNDDPTGPAKRSFFDTLSAEPERMRRFGGAMGFANSTGSHTDVETLLTSFDWRAIPKESKVVDVGGSFGHTASHILRHANNINDVTVQDLPDVIEQAKKTPLQSDLKGRLRFEAASFFEKQPVINADIYLYRGIFVDWPEEKVLEIIRNLVPSMKAGALLVVNEPIVQEAHSGATDAYAAKIVRLLDLQMMVALNAYVKSVSDWKRLALLGSEGKLELVSAQGSVVVFRRKS